MIAPRQSANQPGPRDAVEEQCLLQELEAVATGSQHSTVSYRVFVATKNSIAELNASIWSLPLPVL